MCSPVDSPQPWPTDATRSDGGRPWPDGVALGATVLIPEGPVDGQAIEVTLVARRDVEAAQRAEFQRIRAFAEELRPPDQRA